MQFGFKANIVLSFLVVFTVSQNASAANQSRVLFSDVVDDANATQLVPATMSWSRSDGEGFVKEGTSLAQV